MLVRYMNLSWQTLMKTEMNRSEVPTPFCKPAAAILMFQTWLPHFCWSDRLDPKIYRKYGLTSRDFHPICGIGGNWANITSLSYLKKKHQLRHQFQASLSTSGRNKQALQADI